MAHEVQAQEPLVRLNTTFDVGGKQATVVGFSHKGVQCRVEGEKASHTVPFAVIEAAVAQHNA